MSPEPRQKLEPQKVVTIHIHHRHPEPSGEVVVIAGIGQAEFKNEDDREYRVAVWRKRTHRELAIEMLLPPKQTIAFTSEANEEFHYEVQDRIGQVATGHGGGPIKFEVLLMETGHGGGPIK
ncbi:MAG: hypothetical protein JO119_11945 [Acidobacteria bacterium]|nr:hypothetical protein [Acidobacteriota bacterium]